MLVSVHFRQCSSTSLMEKIPKKYVMVPQLNSLGKENGWMACDFTSFSTVFQSYQDDGQMIMKGYVQWSPFYN